jgi:restriction system protein
MAIPTHEDAMLPVLQALRDGEARHRRVLSDEMADHFALTEAERAQLLPSGKAPVIRSRTGWALSYMKQAGLVGSTRRGWYEITPAGRDVLAANPDHIDNAFLTRFEGFRDFRARSRSEEESDGVDAPIHTAAPESDAPIETPDEALERAYTRLRTAVESELVDTMKGVSPTFFEELVIDLLVRMGYGGNRTEAARAIGRTGDGGIDGVIDEDRLAQRIGTRIVLIDGRRLAALMFEHDVGVSPKRTYIVKDIDGDYFEES